MDPNATQPPQANGWGPEVEDDVNSVDESPEETNGGDRGCAMSENSQRDHGHGSSADCSSIDCSKRQISLQRENKKLNYKIQKLNKELRNMRVQLQQKNDGAGKRTEREWPAMLRRHQGDDMEYPGIYKLSCYEENMNPKILHPALAFKKASPALLHREARICFEKVQREAEKVDGLKNLVLNPWKPRRFLEYRSKFMFHKLPEYVQGEIFKHLFSYPDKLIHAISRLDEFVEPATIPSNGEKKESGLLNRFHITGKYSGQRCALTYAVKGNDLLAPLLVSRQFLFLGLHAFFGCNTFAFSSLGKLGRFSRGIGPARRQRLQHIELLWIGSQIITMEGHSRRTWALASLCEMARLRSLTIYVDEAHVRRKHEGINYMSYLSKRTSGQPDFRMARNLRTLQGIDYVRQTRGLRVLRVLGHKSCEPVRDWTFVLDLETSCKRDKPYNQHQKSKLQQLLPLSKGNFKPSTLEWKAVESYYDTDWNPPKALEDDGPSLPVYVEGVAANLDQTLSRAMSVASPIDDGNSAHGRVEGPARFNDDDVVSDANALGNRGHAYSAAPLTGGLQNRSPAHPPMMDIDEGPRDPNSNERPQFVQDTLARMSTESSTDTRLEYHNPVPRGASHTPKEEHQGKSPPTEEGLFVGSDTGFDDEARFEIREEDRESTLGPFELRPTRGMKRPPSQGFKRPPTYGMKRPPCPISIGEAPEHNNATHESDGNGPGGEVMESDDKEDVGDEAMESEPESDDGENAPGIFEPHPSYGMKRPPTHGMKRPPSQGFKRPPSNGMKRLPGYRNVGEDPENFDEYNESDSDRTSDDETESVNNEHVGDEVADSAENENVGDGNGLGDEVMEYIENEDLGCTNGPGNDITMSPENEDAGDGKPDDMEVDSEDKPDDTSYEDIRENNREDLANTSRTYPEGNGNTEGGLSATSSPPGEEVSISASGSRECDGSSNGANEGESINESKGDPETVALQTEPSDTSKPSEAPEVMPPSNAQKRQGEELLSDRGKRERLDGTE
ncbi:uncharacterized protein DNG_05357 [Cephalotrichum gorgonifer]|uniref:Uncharacterized protein n=1 Tax=Cephalotrichum gorgonifer TaxID=2041049 RepID=A0AAE8SVP8_9PEZI|nr:uncharacterized protein DNG_05357 [Cephalotrichum gorgonifer]